MLARDYLAEIHSHAPEAQRICDKHLGNLVRLGLIATLFPNAYIVHCRRDPVATCVSCYFQHFENVHRFAYDLRHLGLNTSTPVCAHHAAVIGLVQDSCVA
ncbi:MAG: sulfotransferase [Gammaproteobacteria bacterium]|nr:sulfotransferase [Gammaproteobacteria bacterium]